VYVPGRNLQVGSVMSAYIFGTLLFGWYGIFLGSVLLVLSVHFARVVLPALLDAERVQPDAVDPSRFETATEPPAETGTEDVPGGSPAVRVTGECLVTRRRACARYSTYCDSHSSRALISLRPRRVNV